MKIAKNAVAMIDYTLTNDQGEIIDTSIGDQPLTYLHGHKNIIPGLEKELEGKSKGETFKVTVPAKDGYGEFKDALVQMVPREHLTHLGDIEVGMQFQVTSAQGPMIVKVIQADDDTVTFDGNHPLAGMDLHFEITVVEVRSATPEELSHGHAHGPGGAH